MLLWMPSSIFLKLRNLNRSADRVLMKTGLALRERTLKSDWELFLRAFLSRRPSSIVYNKSMMELESNIRSLSVCWMRLISSRDFWSDLEAKSNVLLGVLALWYYLVKRYSSVLGDRDLVVKTLLVRACLFISTKFFSWLL